VPNMVDRARKATLLTVLLLQLFSGVPAPSSP
jgi:hypothetical protein